MADKKETEEIGELPFSVFPRRGVLMTPLWMILREEITRTRYSNYAKLPVADYTLNNPDTLTKYKSAAQISHKVLEAVTALCVAGEKIVTICEKGDKLLDEEISKVYRGKKISKGERQSESMLLTTL
jgi:ferredoxin-fold anticodon binding domain-containing protein